VSVTTDCTDVVEAESEGPVREVSGVTSRRLKQLADVVMSNVDKKSYEDQKLVSICNYTDVCYIHTSPGGRRSARGVSY
jgi:hypothetical protein